MNKPEPSVQLDSDAQQTKSKNTLVTRKEIKDSFAVALPIILGYIALGIPCGILENQAGMSALQAFILSLFMYSGSGQYMIAGMLISGTPLLSLTVTTSLVSSRQLLYSAALAPKFVGEKKWLSLLFANSVTDESFGVNTDRYENDPSWKNIQAYLVNAFSHVSWIASNVVGVIVGSLLSFDTALASFAMTSIFICLFVTQVKSRNHLFVGLFAAAGVVVCKYVGLSNAAIIIGALLGVLLGTIVTIRSNSEKTPAPSSGEAQG